MNREKIYRQWKTTKDSTGEALCNDAMIKKFRKISDQNFQYYIEYQDYLLTQGKAGSLKTIRSKVVDYLIFMGTFDLKDTTQEIIDNYFKRYKNENPKSFNSRIFYLMGFFNYFSLKDNLEIEKFKKATDNKEKSMSRITAEQISQTREKYKNNIKKLFVFEMMYYTSLSMAEIGKIKLDNLDPVTNTLCYKKKKNPIPKSLINLIQTMHYTGEFDKPHDIMSTIKQMRKELAENGLEKLTATDGRETRKTTFWKCPQCGYEYEAIAENWCVKQYTENGENWVVCRERCGNE